MFMIFFFEMPRCVLKRLDCLISRFFRQYDSHKWKYRVANGIYDDNPESKKV
uniref:Uncharacterized protein n=1 Tax=Arundo donax TaxID=35708 RepID=A0A0A9DME8_ARUDO